jgi:release factor glutamine methyltransferase
MAGADLMAEAEAALASAGLDRPRLEAQVLLGHVLGLTRSQVLARWPMDLATATRDAWFRLVAARAGRHPMAYLRGYREFFGLRIAVGPSVLVPRPETELLVERAIALLEPIPNPVVVDVCTGSGCVAAALAARVAGLTVVASDISASAAGYARTNLDRFSAAPQHIVLCANMLDAVRPECAHMVTANPPYIETGAIGDLEPEVRDYEPRLALDGGADGLDGIRAVASEAIAVLKAGGTLLMEMGAGQADAVASILLDGGYEVIGAHTDLSGIMRVVEARKPERNAHAC